MPFSEIRENAHNLSIPLYISAALAGDSEGRLEQVIETWQESRRKHSDQTARLLSSLKEIGYS